jgi:hypothetical protein
MILRSNAKFFIIMNCHNNKILYAAPLYTDCDEQTGVMFLVHFFVAFPHKGYPLMGLLLLCLSCYNRAELKCGRSLTEILFNFSPLRTAYQFSVGGPHIYSALAERISIQRWRTAYQFSIGGPHTNSVLADRISIQRWRTAYQFSVDGGPHINSALTRCRCGLDFVLQDRKELTHTSC